MIEVTDAIPGRRCQSCANEPAEHEIWIENDANGSGEIILLCRKCATALIHVLSEELVDPSH